MQKAAHVLGYVGAISEGELESREDDGGAKAYAKSDEIGKTGVESSFETDLRGTPGQRVYEKDRTGRIVRELEDQRRAPKQGDDVYLSIDAHVQAETEISLRQGLEERRGVGGEQGLFPAEGGAASIVDPTNGQVMAMASYPTYDPSTLVGGIECPVWRDLHGLPAEGSCNDIDQELAAIPADEDIRRKSANYEIIGRPGGRWAPLFEALAVQVADAPPVRPTPLSHENLLGLFKGDAVGRGVVLDPATMDDMCATSLVEKPSLEVVYEGV